MAFFARLLPKEADINTHEKAPRTVPSGPTLRRDGVLNSIHSHAALGYDSEV